VPSATPTRRHVTRSMQSVSRQQTSPRPPLLPSRRDAASLPRFDLHSIATATATMASLPSAPPAPAIAPRSPVPRTRPRRRGPTTARAAAAGLGPGPGEWAPGSWRARPARQIPEYPDRPALEAKERALAASPPLVFAGEVRKLEERLGEAAMGRAFLLQGGDCAESFKDFGANNIRDTFRLMLQMAVVLTFGGQMPTIKVVIIPSWSTNHRSPPLVLSPLP